MLFDRIDQQYGQLSKQQKKVADYLRQDPQAFIDLSSRDLEAKIGVSAATIVRFVAVLGYTSLNEMRVYVAQQIRYDEKAMDLVITPADNADSLELKIMQVYQAAAESLRETLDVAQLAQAIAQLASARHIYLLGVGTSGLLAYDFYHRLNRYGKITFYDTDAHMNLEFLTRSTPEDVVVAISYSGMTKEVILGAEAAQAQGVPVISISGIQDAPLTQCTDTHLFVPQTEHLVRLAAMTSRVHTAMVLDMLFVGIVKDNLEAVHQATVESNQLVTKLKESTK